MLGVVQSVDLLRRGFAGAILSLPKKEHPKAKTGVHHFHGDNNELGTACGRYYRLALDTCKCQEDFGVSTMGFRCLPGPSRVCQPEALLSCVPRALEFLRLHATSRTGCSKV